MVIVKIGDGLGNQLFNYACGYAAAKKNGDLLRLDITECDNSSLRNYELENNFQIDCHDTISYSNQTVFHKVYKRLWRDFGHRVIYERKDADGRYDGRVYTRKKIRNIYLYGYWQNHKYFDFCKDDVIRQFRRKGESKKEVAELQKWLRETKTCALHIRGGDIQPLEVGYFKQAVKTLLDRVADAKIVVFTNDYDVAKKIIASCTLPNLRFANEMGKFSDIDEFFLMSSCQNQIIANSTYSWWSAYLNHNPEKVVIAPFSTTCDGQYYPENWIQI